MEAVGITHILSVIKYSLEDDKLGGFAGKFTHLSVDVDDMEDEDLLVHLPRCVRFIENGLYPKGTEIAGHGDTKVATLAAGASSTDTIAPTPIPANATSTELAPPTPGAAADRGLPGSQPTGAVFVHCAMGKSRSVTAVIAYLLWKYPHRFGTAEAKNPDRQSAAALAVSRALKLVRESRGIAEPNPGFMSQLELWWEMGRPAESSDAVERHPMYQRWLYKKEVEDSVKLGKVPDWIIFEDEAGPEPKEQPVGGLDLRCKKCRQVLATKQFLIPHEPLHSKSPGACPHFFVEPLSWMRPVLEEGLLDGRLVCPNGRCGATIGRYSWQGFKCSCGEWVCPAFSLQRSRVDDIVTRPRSSDSGEGRLSEARATTSPAALKENL